MFNSCAWMDDSYVNLEPFSPECESSNSRWCTARRLRNRQDWNHHRGRRPWAPVSVPTATTPCRVGFSVRSRNFERLFANVRLTETPNRPYPEPFDLTTSFSGPTLVKRRLIARTARLSPPGCRLATGSSRDSVTGFGHRPIIINGCQITDKGMFFT